MKDTQLHLSAALDALTCTLDRHNLIKLHPDIAHDLLATQVALAVAQGNQVYADYWAAQLLRLRTQHPTLEAGPAVVVPEAGAVMAAVRERALLMPLPASVHSEPVACLA